MISSVTYAMKILEALGDEPEGMSVAGIQKLTGIDKSSVSRILATLEADDYIQRVPNTELFRLNIRFPGIALRFIEKTNLLELCLPVLKEIAEETGELVQLALAGAGGPPIYVAKARSQNRIQALPLIGTQAVPHASTAGKLWLASMPEFDAIATLRNTELKKVSTKTNIDPSRLIKDVRRIRAEGYAIIEGELSEEINAVAVPLRHTRTGRFIGALCLAVPAYRATGEALLGYLPVLNRRAPLLAEVLNYCALCNGDPAAHEVPSEATETV